jgi:hypothetical protein
MDTMKLRWERDRGKLKFYKAEYISFDFDGYINNNPSWLSDDGEYFLYWNTGTTSQWTVSGYTNGAIFNQNPNTPPKNGRATPTKTMRATLTTSKHSEKQGGPRPQKPGRAQFNSVQFRTMRCSIRFS